MTAPTRSTVIILPPTQGAAGSTEASPGVTGAWVDVSTLNGGLLQPYVANGGTAPAAPGQFILQASDVNTGSNISELWRGGGSTTANSSPPIPQIILPSEYKYVRMLGFGNTNAAVTYSCNLLAKG